MVISLNAVHPLFSMLICETCSYVKPPNCIINGPVISYTSNMYDTFKEQAIKMSAKNFMAGGH
uniref:Uncharacterized protein n=1 Tax=Oryza sativa subsp. japonica TaxID=39947 RepID=Q2QYE0_ORYSJ|nr:hypothetical protein LOC_Os12g02990 [Oryza sativa Japonica Group]